MKVRLYFDGACEPVNPGGVGTWGFVLKDDDGDVIDAGHGVVGEGEGITNNVAEYHALGHGLKAMAQRSIVEHLTIYGDSKLVVNQVGRELQCNDPHLAKLLRRCHQLIGDVVSSSWRVELLSSDHPDMKEPDDLSRLSYELHRCGSVGNLKLLRELMNGVRSRAMLPCGLVADLFDIDCNRWLVLRYKRGGKPSDLQLGEAMSAVKEITSQLPLLHFVDDIAVLSWPSQPVKTQRVGE